LAGDPTVTVAAPVDAAPATEPRRPAILCVDDEPAVLAAVARDLRRRFGEGHRIVRAGSGAEALELLAELRRRGDEVALMISDQRMPQMQGTELLTRARRAPG
jgi:thioredoxin reductase (NADPH)